MIITIKKSLATTIGLQHFEEFDISETSWDWKDLAQIELYRYPRSKIEQLLSLVESHRHARGAGVLAKDIKSWIKAVENVASGVPRTVKQFHGYMMSLFHSVPGHRCFKQHGDKWLCYYVSEIEHREAVNNRDHRVPEHVIVTLVYEEFGSRRERDERFFDEDCVGMPVSEALSRKNYQPENTELRRDYLATIAKYRAVHHLVGTQFLATGTGTDDLDGNPSRSGSWFYNRTNCHDLIRNGEPSKVVIDVFNEDPKSDRDRHIHVSPWFWSSVSKKIVVERQRGKDKEIVERALSEGELGDLEERPEIEIPIHPFCAAFDLVKHLRLRIHVDNLLPYQYDKSMATKIIMPNEIRRLVHMLLQYKDGMFQDIVKGKAGGAVVLLAGPPGVGKTLTAEVFAESEERPLYSIQCSQLGTNPDELEDNLLKVFARAKRWNAVLLLDEADVYVRARGDDLTQNAIVGVFLRTLEYQQNIMFLTTNRPDSVDDAVASRCIARISYPLLSGESLKEAWGVLSRVANIKMAEGAIDEIVRQIQIMSGRDVKQLLKLAALLNRNGEVGPDDVAFVKTFQPTITPPSLHVRMPS